MVSVLKTCALDANTENKVVPINDYQQSKTKRKPELCQSNRREVNARLKKQKGSK